LHVSSSVALLTLTRRSASSPDCKNLTEKQEESTVLKLPHLENDRKHLSWKEEKKKGEEKNQTEDYFNYQTACLYEKKKMYQTGNFTY